jgi:4-hydroxy-tetrahydrodipicolinate reductase
MMGQVNGCTGKMGQAVAEAAIAAGLQLVPKCITGRGRARGYAEFSIQGIKVDVVDGDEREKVMDEVLQDYPDLIVVDYTLPAAVNGEHTSFSCSRCMQTLLLYNCSLKIHALHIQNKSLLADPSTAQQV